jgi:hypothetical protein
MVSVPIPVPFNLPGPDKSSSGTSKITGPDDLQKCISQNLRLGNPPNGDEAKP